jgi:hypothetical protein
MEVEIKLPANSRRTLKPSKREKNNMASKPFEEKQVVKEVAKEKELLKHEKQEKPEKGEKPEKEHKDQKDQKDNPDTKQHKDAKDQKDTPDSKHKQEKEKHEKEQKHEKEHKPENKEALLEKVHKDSEVPSGQTPFAAAVTVGGAHKLTDKSMIADKLPQPEAKLQKEIKLEIKEHKSEKFEIKEYKFEKFELKEIKWEYEGIGVINDPGGPVEQRLAALEATVTKLLHFIPENLRPDLTQGALKQEPDAPKDAAKPADPKADPHQKGKS